MDLRQLSPDLAVSPQILPEDLPLLAEAGFKTLINNRPDDEVDATIENQAMAIAAQNAGMEYHYLPFSPGQITPDLVEGYAKALTGPRPAVAYCRSGNRSTILWALANAGRIPQDDLLKTAAEAGYDLTPVLPLIQSLANR